MHNYKLSTKFKFWRESDEHKHYGVVSQLQIKPSPELNLLVNWESSTKVPLIQN